MLILHVISAVALVIWTIGGAVYISRRAKHAKKNCAVCEKMNKYNDKY